MLVDVAPELWYVWPSAARRWAGYDEAETEETRAAVVVPCTVRAGEAVRTALLVVAAALRTEVVAPEMELEAKVVVVTVG